MLLDEYFTCSALVKVGAATLKSAATAATVDEEYDDHRLFAHLITPLPYRQDLLIPANCESLVQSLVKHSSDSGKRQNNSKDIWQQSSLAGHMVNAGMLGALRSNSEKHTSIMNMNMKMEMQGLVVVELGAGHAELAAFVLRVMREGWKPNIHVNTDAPFPVRFLLVDRQRVRREADKRIGQVFSRNTNKDGNDGTLLDSNNDEHDQKQPPKVARGTGRVGADSLNDENPVLIAELSLNHGNDDHRTNNQGKGKKNSAVLCERLCCDLCDLRLAPALEPLLDDIRRENRRTHHTNKSSNHNRDANSNVNVVSIAKHLCGEATDMSIRAVVRAADTTNATAADGTNRHVKHHVAIATCCHHRCSWATYVNKSWYV